MSWKGYTRGVQLSSSKPNMITCTDKEIRLIQLLVKSYFLARVAVDRGASVLVYTIVHYGC